MKGRYVLEVQRKGITFRLVLERQVTVITGDSGTGKTSFVNTCRMLVDGSNSKVKSTYKDRVFVLEKYMDWDSIIESKRKCFIIVDEGCAYIRSKAFASAVAYSDNYFILISRTALPFLNYSVSSVCEFTSTKRNDFVLTELSSRVTQRSYKVLVDCIVTEDSNSGYEMYRSILSGSSTMLVSAKGKDNVCDAVDTYRFANKEGGVCAIVDGSAFGNSLLRYVNIMSLHKNVYLLAPESFEYLLLKSGLFRLDKGMLEETWNYCDSVDYVSWEAFFTDLLSKVSQGYGVWYSKSRLNPFFLGNEKVRDYFLGILKDEFLLE